MGMKERMYPEPLFAPEHVMGSFWVIPAGETITATDGRVIAGQCVVRVTEYAGGSRMVQVNNDFYPFKPSDFQEDQVNAGE